MKKALLLMLTALLLSTTLGGCTQRAQEPKPVKIQQQATPHIRPLETTDNAADLTAAAEDLGRDVAASWPYVGQFWSGMSLKAMHLYITNGGRVMDVSADHTQEIPLRDIDAVMKMPSREHAGQYYPIKVNGNEGLLVRISDADLTKMKDERAIGSRQVAKTLFQRSTAMMFRVYMEEPQWKKAMALQTDRTIAYPILAKPRAYRAMMLKHLSLALMDTTGREGQLKFAKYWYNQYKEYAPEDAGAMRFADVMHGSAEYVADMADAFAAVGHDAGEEAIRTFLVKKNTPKLIPASEPLTAESDHLGRIAGRVADELHIPWKKEAAEGVPAYESLLRNVAYEWEAMPSDVTSEVEEIVRARNQELATTVDLFLNDINDKKRALLIIPGDALQQRYLVNGYYRHKDYNGQVWNQFTGQWNMDSGTLALRLKTIGLQQNTYTAIDSLKKVGIIAVIPLWDVDYTLEQGMMKMKAGLAEGAFRVDIATDQYGRRLYIADQPDPKGTSINPLRPLAEKKPIRDLEGHWAKDVIQQLVDQGIMQGYTDGTFRPDARITRAEFTKIVVDAFHLKPQAGKIFDDTKGHWAKDAIATAVGHGIAEGISDSQFAPNDPITRQEVVMILVKAAKLPKVNLPNPERRFKDIWDTAFWAQDEVFTAAAQGIIGGDASGRVRPRQLTTRAEAATMLFKTRQTKKS
ncbi:S-layer homology domain-containing protein [Paenibacillus guangzhouensis]|uniref:S-layer homology domain-containing protein n=1 Tax=Paenibacillus guangzhouensis TaxID=1473112 RepID=UPI00126779AD|nr:S-layer homology domain-containing protein [Paenibacillus guangzhouensis]